MRLSLLVRSAALGCAVWLGATGALAQSGYVTNGGEYAIAGSIPGDQVHPALSLSASGGYLVWQGNEVCPFGLGIGAIALDNSLHQVGSRFRVNQLGVGDQENPQVTLLNGGGAAFVWQGGRQSFQHIYGRFLTASNTWGAGDLLISSSTNRFQRNPALATLANGNVVVAYSSFNQATASSMQDVYAQVLSPTGQKVVNEFRMNQFTAFNQRNPAVAAVSNGFVAVWVSELQRSGSPDKPNLDAVYSNTNALLPTVDIYARLFDANGSPLGTEFLVNTSSNVCSHPSVASAADGSFVITWAERSVAAGVAANGWDVFARPFNSDLTAGSASLINTYVQGDQFAPQISNVGTNYLVVWTSTGQDGSFEGVYGRLLQSDGSTLSDEFRVNSTTFGRQYQPTIASDKVGRFLTVWAGYNTTGHSQDLYAQAYGLAGFVPGPAVVQYAPPPAEGFIDVPPTSGPGPLPPSTLAGWTLPLPTTASLPVVSNGSGALPGNYNGLFYDTNGVNVTSAGSISVKVTARYSYSAKLLVAGKSYSVSGQFNTSGQDTKTVTRPAGLGNLAVNLQLVHLDNAGGDEIRGTVTATGWQAQVVADRQVYNRTSNKALAYAGQYTLVVPPTTTGPAGSGFGTLTIDTAGNVRWAASLADGSKITQASTLSAQGYWPLYASLYKGKGLIASWVQIAANNAGGQVIWIKPPGAMATLFAGSFTNSVDAVISSYSKATAVSMFKNGTVSFNGGSLAGQLTKSLSLDAHGKSLTPAATGLNVILSPSTGLFHGTTTLLSTGGKVSFQGVLLENGHYGAGFFQNNGASGQVYWSLQ